MEFVIFFLWTLNVINVELGMMVLLPELYQ